MKTRKLTEVVVVIRVPLPENVSEQGVELQEVKEQLQRLVKRGTFPLRNAEVVSMGAVPEPC